MRAGGGSAHDICTTHTRRQKPDCSRLVGPGASHNVRVVHAISIHLLLGRRRSKAPFADGIGPAPSRRAPCRPPCRASLNSTCPPPSQARPFVDLDKQSCTHTGRRVCSSTAAPTSALAPSSGNGRFMTTGRLVNIGRHDGATIWANDRYSTTLTEKHRAVVRLASDDSTRAKGIPGA